MPHAEPAPPAANEPLGLIAGNGDLPLLFARAARARGVPVIALALHNETRPDLCEHVDVIHWVRIGQLGRMIRTLRQAGVKRAAMAGGVPKTRLFSGARPDWQALRLLSRLLVRRDDALLRAIAGEFEAAGIQIVESTLMLSEALTPSGVLTAAQPSPQHWQDLQYGLHIARRIGELDVGQTVVVKDGAVVALEGMEGTDACIRRAGDLLQGKASVVVKVAKPAQDMRFDVPAVGSATLDSMLVAGVRVLGLEAGRTLLLSPQAVVEQANRLGQIVVGVGEH
jgi:DUF1009 family protein